MAGIGFSLNRLFDRPGILSLGWAYGVTAMVAIGPIACGMLALFGISTAGALAGLDEHARELTTSLVTYSLLFALLETSCSSMVLSRHISDLLFLERPQEVLRSLHGALSLMLPVAVLVFGGFLCLSGVGVGHGILALWLALVMVVVWTESLYLSAMRDYRTIVYAFVVACLAGFVLALVFVVLGVTSVTTLMLSTIACFGLLMVWYYAALLTAFGRADRSFAFVSWFDRHARLALTGLLLHVGLFSHILLRYLGPLHVVVDGLVRSAPAYDVPALAAYLSTFASSVSFVALVEVRFFGAYDRYYTLYRAGGTLRGLRGAWREMVRMARLELHACFVRQGVCTLLFFAVGPLVLKVFIPGITELSCDVFMMLCVGYGLYAMGNCMLMLLLYFEDYDGALLAAVPFAAITTVLTVGENLLGATSLAGLSFVVGAAVFFVVAWLRLDWCFDHLDYLLLGRQPLSVALERGPLARRAEQLEELFDRCLAAVRASGERDGSTDVAEEGERS